eukprot:CAMPEP_0114549286 /NCGR_PEP_ID=MMETSP0114-20121206/5446_1 /TAXON_ID=31324 /ORGANISM="Goniomonas sp, Strain m" /LENGTH=151 /DNA_ID=CAMNT_0001733957 /DNA_START=42 /DNA_END=497 /DNA_ORIENTATION=-
MAASPIGADTNPDAKVKQLIAENQIMVFSKSYCPFCNAAKTIFEGKSMDYTAFEIDLEADGPAIQDALQRLTGQRTVPNIFIKTEHIGGHDAISALDRSGGLAKLIPEDSAGADIAMLVNLGFDRARVLEALKSAGGDHDAALDILLTGAE